METMAKEHNKKDLRAAEAEVKRLRKDFAEYNKSEVGKNLLADTVIDTVKILHEKFSKDHPEVEWDSMALIMHILNFMDSGRKASELEPIAGLEVPSPAAEGEEADEEEEEGAEDDEGVEGEEEEGKGQVDGERGLPEPQGTPEGAVQSEEE
ncbi:unnamed protein product [Linum trigynum]|uniref:Uncharacterized protein n=1 Tax=Linum trigynum TaxID=586398 RepID=A0AAV2CB96_9ROSI